MTKKDIRLIWVPGHNSIPGNEIADEIAKRATKELTDFWNIATHFDLKYLINTNLDHRCHQEWRLFQNNKLREIKSSTLLGCTRHSHADIKSYSTDYELATRHTLMNI